jgi:hypothetical protein
MGTSLDHGVFFRSWSGSVLIHAVKKGEAKHIFYREDNCLSPSFNQKINKKAFLVNILESNFSMIAPNHIYIMMFAIPYNRMG